MNSLQEQILKERNAELETALGNKMLELQQKTRDLEIEAALERVRSSALAMKQPADMLNICRIIAGQLEVLNVREIRNVQTAIFYPAKSAYVNYEFYVKHDKTLITEVDYSTHTVQSTFAEQMMKGPNEFFTQGFKGKEVQDWYAYQKTTNVFLDSYLETVSSLNYYWFSLGPVALGMSAYQPLSEDQIILFQRFRNVFGLAYRRYLDIEKAEAQAREAQIQLALERIRARTMAMRKSDEISDAVYLLFEQFKDLGEDPIQITIGIFNEEEKVIHLNITGLDGSGSRIHQLFKMEIDEPSLLNKLYKAWKAQKKSIVLELAGQELLDWITYRNAIARNYNMAGTTIASNERRFISAGLFSKGFISFSKSDLIPGQTTEILKRFAGVFDSTYTRFLDLQKAEAQARESRIQLALERARSQSMMMKHSRELDDTLRVFHEQVLQLNIPSAFSFLWLPDEVKDEHIFWAAWAENNSFKSKAISYPLDRNDPATAQCLIDWKSNQPVVAYHVPPGGVPAYFASWSELIAGVEELTPEHFSEGLYYVEAFMKYGCFGIMVKQPLSEDNKKILERFAIEFERAYTRFLDLQKAEEQAREAQVEAALERVRSRTLAMHKSDELAETAAVVFRQLIGLGIAPNRLYIGVIKDETGEKIELWATDEDGTKVSTQFTGNVNRNESIKKMYEGWKTQQKSIIIDMQGKELADYFHYLSEELNVPFQLGLTQKRRVQTIAYFSRGFIGMASPDPQTDETTKLLERFAYVFNLTYTRFNDLQHAEDQTRKAQIEVALERVRARALAMQTSGELIEVAHAMREQMGILGQPDMETAAVHLYTKDAASFESWYAFRPIRQSTGEIITGTATFAVDSCELVREFVAIHFSGVNEYTIEVDEFKQLEWNKVLATAIPAITEVFYQEFKGPLPKTYFHFSDFSGGSLVMVTYQPPSEDVINLQHRAASVFDLAYRRFLDIQHKEEQALRLLQEKERLEFTLTELRATQSQLIQSEKMASLGELTAGIAHEIQNPLNFVNNFSDINSELIDEQLQELKAGNIQDAIEIANDIKQNEEKINHHGKRADSIVKGMLQHSRSSTGQKEPTDVNKLADEYLRLSYHGLRAKDHGFNAEIETNFDDSIGSIKIIPQDIGRVLLNLYNNAFYAVGERRKLEGLGYEPTVSLNTKKMDDKIEIEVADNGSGIPQKVVDKIFQPFFTTKPTGQGTGLGLSLSYDIVKAHGGEIKVESSEGIGTTFIIHIPVT